MGLLARPLRAALFLRLGAVLLLVSIFCSNSLEVCAEEQLTLQECVVRALEVNEQIKSSRYGLEAQEFTEKQAAGNMGPRLVTDYDYRRFDEEQSFFSGSSISTSKDRWTWDTRVEQPLFRGLELLSTYQREALRKNISEQQLRQTRLNIILAVQQAFFSYLQEQENVRSARAALERLRSQYQVAVSFNRVGLVPKFDVLSAETDVAFQEQVLVQATNNVRIQRSRLNTLLNLHVSEEIDYVGRLVYVPFTQSFDYCLETAEKQRPDLIIAQLSVEAAEKDRRIAASGFYPDVSAVAGYERFSDEPGLSSPDSSVENDEWRAGVSLSWELFSSGSTLNAVRSAERVVSQLESERISQENEAQFDVRSNFDRLEAAAIRIKSAQKGVVAAREGFRQAEARYKAQVGTSTDVLNAQSNLTQAEFLLSEAYADYLTALAELYASMGVENGLLAGDQPAVPAEATTNSTLSGG